VSGLSIVRITKRTSVCVASDSTNHPVAAEDVDAPEVLNGRQVLDDHTLARHPNRTGGEGDRGNHRQELRGEAHTERDGEQQ
jgi:hypothetical protein